MWATPIDTNDMNRVAGRFTQCVGYICCPSDKYITALGYGLYFGPGLSYGDVFAE